MATDLPQGQRFSHAYVDRGEPTDDSVRMRRRIGSQIYEVKPLAEQLASEVRRELGIHVPYPVNWPVFLEEAQLRDVLDLVTVAFRILQAGPCYSQIVGLQTSKEFSRKRMSITEWMIEAAYIFI
jgi:hypothetical protein